MKPPTSPIPSSTTALGPAKSKEEDATQVRVEANVVPVPDSISNVSVEEDEVKQAVEEEEVTQADEKKERPLSPYAR